MNRDEETKADRRHRQQEERQGTQQKFSGPQAFYQGQGAVKQPGPLGSERDDDFILGSTKEPTTFQPGLVKGQKPADF